MSDIDDTIYQLQKKVDLKKEQLEASKPKAEWQSNMNIKLRSLGGHPEEYNINSFNTPIRCVMAHMKVTDYYRSLRISAIELGLTEELGFTKDGSMPSEDDPYGQAMMLLDYMADIKTKLSLLKYNDEKKELDKMSKTLEGLKSEAAKKKEQLDEISNTLKG